MSNDDTVASTSPERPMPGLRRKLVLLLCGMALVGILAWALQRPKTPVIARGIGARLELAAGEVSVSEGGGAIGSSPGKSAGRDGAAIAGSGTPLPSGASVATGRGARALVRTEEGCALFLRGESEIGLRDRGFDLRQGEVWVSVPRLDGDSMRAAAGDFAITASDAGLDVKLGDRSITVYVAHGLAVLTSPKGRIEIQAGEQGTASSDKPPVLAPVAFWHDWTGGMGDHHGIASGAGASGRLYGIETRGGAGAKARPLEIGRQAVRAVLRAGIAETEVDQTFSNPTSQPVEGWYWFTVPPEAAVTSFALETDGVLVEGEIIEKQEASAKYAAAMRAARDPALLEWIDGRTYRARIFPVPANGTRRVVLRYLELLTTIAGKTRYVYPMRSDEPLRIEEFSLSVDVGNDASLPTVAASLDARVEDGGRRVTMRRSGYLPRADFQLEVATPNVSPVRAWRFLAGADQADYVMMRYVPEVDWARVPKLRGDVVVVVDTSAGGDESARQLRPAAAEAILRALSDEDQFALVALDVKPTVLYPKGGGLARASEPEIAKGLEQLSEHAAGGSTDLGAMFEPSLERLHGTEQPAIVYVGDGAPTSGETQTENLLDRLRRSLTGSRARLFCIGIGTDAHHDLMQQLVRAGGGQYFRVDDAADATSQALRLASALKDPTITDLKLDLGAGLDQPFLSVNGKVSRGEEVVLLARTHHPLPPTLKVSGRLGGKDFAADHPVRTGDGVATSLVPRLWASEFVHRLLGQDLEQHRSKVLELGLEYGLLTPFTSSLALESEAAYASQGIRRRSTRLRGVHLSAIDSPRKEEELAASFVVAAPLAVFGCGRSAPSSGEAAPEVVLPTAAPGMGLRARAEESKASPAAVQGSKSAVGPAENEGARVRSFGMVGALSGTSTEDRSDAQRQSADAPVPPITPATEAPGGVRGAETGVVALAPLVVGEAHRVAGSGERASLAKPKAPAREDQAARDKVRPPPPPPSPPPPSPPPSSPPKQETERLAKAVVIPPTKRPMRICSDAANRPLVERIVLWTRRLRQSTGVQDLLTQFDAAHDACELPDWRDMAAMLDLLQQRVDTEKGAELLLAHFEGDGDAQRYLAKAILRRTVDLRMAGAVSRILFGGRVDWSRVDRELLDLPSDDKRLLHLRTTMLGAPGDPAGEVRLVRLLAKTGSRTEALGYGRRLRDRGFLTPTLAQQLGDVLVEENLIEEAMRTYSELVEFDDRNILSRQLLGDIYLRHGWYAAAYRQYRTLVDLDPKNPASSMRLASAAAGAGRVDEALRIEREVASENGSPGPNDPRYWARLWSAARLSALLEGGGSPADAERAESIGRKLKTLQLVSGPSTLVMLTWEDLEAQLLLANADQEKETLAGETTDAAAVGLFAIALPSDSWPKKHWAVRWKADPPSRDVKFSVVTLTWDGRAFTAKAERGQVAQRDKQTVL